MYFAGHQLSGIRESWFPPALCWTLLSERVFCRGLSHFRRPALPPFLFRKQTFEQFYSSTLIHWQNFSSSTDTALQ
jgi:hypothetical protein